MYVYCVDGVDRILWVLGLRDVQWVRREKQLMASLGRWTDESEGEVTGDLSR